MSWFSHAFSASFRNSRSERDEEEDEKEQQQQQQQQQQQDIGASSRVSGKGVKDDLFEFRKSIATQLWGVASFLAPSSHGESKELQEDEGRASNEEALTRLGKLPNQESFIYTVDSGGAKAGLLATDLEHQDSENLVRLVQQDGESFLSSDEGSLSQTTKFRGVRSDLAELKGSVATGISRIMQVVKEEIDKQGHENVGKEEEDESFRSPDAPNIPPFNTILEPIFGKVFSTENEKDAEEEGLDAISEGEKPVDRQMELAQEGMRQLGLQEALAGISKLASTLFLSNDKSDEEDFDMWDNVHQAPGMTEEVLAFAREVSMHPETWIDFPLTPEEDDTDDFEISEAQQQHVTAVELAAPRLAALRIELCPGYMRTGCFWKIYFVLLHSRLSGSDAVLLSTPQIMKVRSLLLQKLQKEDIVERKRSSENLGEITTKMNRNFSDHSSDSVYVQNLSSELERKGESYKIVSLEAATEVPCRYFKQSEGQKFPSLDAVQDADPASEIADEVQNKNVLPSTVKLTSLICENEDAETDDWLHEEPSPRLTTQVILEDDDDVTFSDFEEEEEKASPFSQVLKPDEGSTSKAVPFIQLNKDSRSKEPGRSTAFVWHKGDTESLDEDGFSSILDGNRPGEQGTQLTDRGEYSDWFTVDEDDIASG